MESFRRSVLIVSLILFLAGCSSVQERKEVFASLSPDRISPAHWKKLVGVYKGSVHSSASAFGSTGVNEMDVRLELSGTPDEPLVYLMMDSSASSAWNASVTYSEKFTNIPQRVYGGRKPVLVYSHAPNQLLISLEPEMFSPNRGAAMILTFHGNAFADVDYIGHFARRGNGSLSRVPFFNLNTQ